MPLIRISLPKSLSKEVKNNVSLSVHHALIEEFNIPQNDFFHVIEELDPDQMHFPESYLGISHTSDIVYIQIIAGEGRTFDQKKRLYKAIADKIEHSTHITANNIIIVLLENNGFENWSFGNGEAQIPKHLKSE
ncbi:tautomerase family protein [uncultured Bacteroides sp.]|uniref:tautomerase family protein n=1 Tax=uncultured Bacteroides sp. TaxID=162156 RepID=UPI002AAC100A|nr:tautomerase family protein [uncultured Bacteroides sp.]